LVFSAFARQTEELLNNTTKFKEAVVQQQENMMKKDNSMNQLKNDLNRSETSSSNQI
jgi:hypothetical protein